MDKRKLWTLLAAGALLVALPAATSLETTTDVPTAAPVPTGGAPGGVWLLVLDENPWGRTANQDALEAQGIPYTQITSAELATTPLLGFQGILIPSVQQPLYYQNLDSSADAIADFVASGGLLVAHATQQYWSNSADGFLPGCTSYTQSGHNTARIVDPDSPIVDGVPESALQGWGSTAHGHIDDLPATSNVVVEDGAGRPIYADYPWGLGHVFATGMTLEWVYWQGPPRSLLIDNEVALQVVPDILGGLTNLLENTC